MSIRNYIIATAGHVDHGKSALVKALTGTDPDRLPEEKARGITIELGFANLTLPGLNLGIVDVPGHEDFVKNMVAGVGSIDLALFIVAADDGWMPQTEEHLQILTYLGVTRAVVALTKGDLLPANDQTGPAAVREWLRGSPFADAPIVKTSVVTGAGLDELKQELAQVLASAPPPRDIEKPRLPVDRVFTLRGVGTVVTGTLSGGQLRRGQGVVIQPKGTATRIRSVQSHGQDVEISYPGTRTALNLPDVAVGEEHAGGVQRGDTVTLAEFGKPHDTADVLLEKSPRLLQEESPSARPLKDGTLVRVHHSSANYPARVVIPWDGPLPPGGRRLAQLRFESPVFMFAGDRFIIRDWSEQMTLAGGIVLEPDASRRRLRTTHEREFLRQRSESPDDLRAAIVALLQRDKAVKRGTLFVKSRFSSGDISGAVDALAGAGGLVVSGDWIVQGEFFRQACARAADAIRAEHRAHPDRAGLALTELRRVLELPDPALFDVLVASLCREGFAQTGAAIRDLKHRLALPPQLEAVGKKLRVALNTKPFEPPSRKELAPDAPALQALRFLVQTGEVIELDADTVMLADHYGKAAELIKAHLQKSGGATASDLRQLLNTNRRVIIPLLERLDKEGLTARQGDKRVLKKK
ncbi:MAG: selenocysteine-specific translation elongation factor [Verrucomicrobia subdivision 3 bacterium]|nr:selenocysteine-specific translation elongation factor [Limisphaerales bacterium]